MNRGQALSEFLIGCSLLLITWTGGLALLKTQWDRLSCARLAFVSAHDQRMELPSIPHSKVRTTKNSNGIEITAHCGKAIERISLPHLEQERVKGYLFENP